MKRIIVLVGPKGAGKSTICSILEKELGIKFVRVEPLFLETRAELGSSHPDYERAGFQKVLSHLIQELSHFDTICFESTGASEQTHWLLSELRKQAEVLPVQVQADPAQCVERIHTRDSSIHIPVSDEQIERINAIAFKTELDWTAQIDNRGDLDRSAIVETIRSLLSSLPG